MIYDNWTGLVRVAVVGTCAYGALLLLLRISGKRTLSKLNAFDLVVTVALGSTLATIILSKDTALVEGVFALALLIALQFAITWSSVRSAAVSRMVKAEPRLVYHRGEFLRDAMRAERVEEGEILQVMRSQGIARREAVHAVVLETDGSLSVLRDAAGGRPSALANVAGVSEARNRLD